jgi:hypothetical protein
MNLGFDFGNYVFPYPQIDWNNLDTRVVTEQNKWWYNLKNDEILKKNYFHAISSMLKILDSLGRFANEFHEKRFLMNLDLNLGN